MKNQENNATTKTTTTIANALEYNSRFMLAKYKLNADQIGAENYAQWKTIVNNFHRACYAIGEHCSNNGLKLDKSNVDMTSAYDCGKLILNLMGEVNGRKLYINDEFIITCIGYATKMGKLDSKQVEALDEEIKANNRALTELKKLNGINPATIEDLTAKLEELKAKKVELLNIADERVPQTTETTFNSFKTNLERYLGNIIKGQLAKTQEELDKEEEERKAKRAANRKAKKQANANA